MRNRVCLFMFFCFFCLRFLQAQEARTYPQGWVPDTSADNQFAPGQSQHYLAFLDATTADTALHILRWLDKQTAVIQLSSPEEFESLKTRRLLHPVNQGWKLLFPGNPPADSMTGADFLLQFNGWKERDAFEKEMESTRLRIRGREDHPPALVVNCSYAYLWGQLLPRPDIQFADQFVPARTESSVIGYKRYWNGVNGLDYDFPFANGKGRVVGVKEQRMQAADLDLVKRVLPSSLAANTISAHATAISTLIGGAGNSFYDGRGVANACSFFPSSYDRLFPDPIETLRQNNLTVQNHSYGTIVQSYYGMEALSYDEQCWRNRELIHVFSSGNSGLSAPAEGPYALLSGFANLTGNFKMAKNIITVGAIGLNGQPLALSSSGPAYDGRLAPQLAALGANGSSDAAALVSGTAAVLQQVYADAHQQLVPPADLVKAVLYNSATDVYRPGIDYKTGYGLLNSYEAVKTILDQRYFNGQISAGTDWTKDIYISDHIAGFKITLCWTDSAAATANLEALINDLDLELEAPGGGEIFYPWVLNKFPHPDSLQLSPVRKKDRLNTSEQISLAFPRAGQYRVRIKSFRLATPSIPFSLAWSADTLDHFSFTNPRHSSDLIREEDPVLAIRWASSFADSSAMGSLSVSYDNGSHWQLIAGQVTLNSKRYEWELPDTQATAQLRMHTAAGDFYSPAFLLGPVNRPALEFLCADSLRMSWRKTEGAETYRVFALLDSTCLQPLFDVRDTFIVINRRAQSATVYAVEPLLPNDVKAPRSIAFDVNYQGVNCFYRALNSWVSDSGRVDLQLELSATSGVENLFFERVKPDGQILDRSGYEPVVDQKIKYDHRVAGLAAGRHLFRAGILLSGGTTVYTPTVEATVAGAQPLLLYPNPVANGGLLHYVMRNQSGRYRLLFYDLNGRQVFSTELFTAGSVQLPMLPPGLHFFRLIDEKVNQIDTGKLFIR